MRVSVIVPCHNAAKTLDACLCAIRAQTLAVSEIIVVDDASTDACADIASRHGCTLIRQPANRGVSAARNAGAAASRGEVLFFVDADIALEPAAIANAVAILRADQRCAVVHGTYDAEPLVNDGPVEEYKVLSEYRWRTDRAGVVGFTLFALTAIRRSVFEAVGGFDERLRNGEDVEFGTRLPAGCLVRMSNVVIGRHDDVDRLPALLAEQFKRAVGYADVVKRARTASGSRTGALHPIGVICCALTVASTLTIWAWPPMALLALCGIAGFILTYRSLLRFALQRKGFGFTVYTGLLHFLVNAANLGGALVGLTRWALR
ncbi:glycosyltransferase family 2 protein [Allorhizocola rhizosphaerae]|uniref:glycosyltransferase family 2 protein n=1 Tax=Allorhizocola rhizosphaerae TaxID=1872709 RepID=UPI000E3C921E|nr:glycosyltransferase family A protein [Allorhizocola rhizosphaerae]